MAPKKGGAIKFMALFLKYKGLFAAVNKTSTNLSQIGQGNNKLSIWKNYHRSKVTHLEGV